MGGKCDEVEERERESVKKLRNEGCGGASAWGLVVAGWGGMEGVN